MRSGLYGGADTDGDKQVSYRELAAFVERANAAIANERFRPDVYARPPPHGDQLLDLRGGLRRRIELDSSRQTHLLLEDAAGVRLVELHNARGQSLQLVRPEHSGILYARNLSDQNEFLLPPTSTETLLAALVPQLPHSAARGALHDAFGALFALPLDKTLAAQYRFRPLLEPAAVEGGTLPGVRLRRALGGAALAVAGVAGITGLLLEFAVKPSAAAVPPGADQTVLFAANQRITQYNEEVVGLLGTAAATGAAGLLLLLWPSSRVRLQASAKGMALGYQSAF